MRLAFLPLLLALLATPARADEPVPAAGPDPRAATEDFSRPFAAPSPLRALEAPRSPLEDRSLEAGGLAGGEAAGKGSAPAATDDRPGSPLATAVAVFPGLLAPGLGHLALGERDAAFHFFAADAAALVLLFSGLATQSVSGGSGDLAPGFLLQTNAGIALLSTLWLADIVGSARGSQGWAPPARHGDSLALSLGYTGLFGSRLAVGHGARADLELRRGRLSLEPSIAALGGGFLDTRARASFAIWRPAAGANLFALTLGAGWQRFAGDGFSVGGAELLGDLHLDLGLISRTLRNAALILRLGAGVDAFDWDGRAFSAGDALPRLVLELGMELPLSRHFGLELLYRFRKDELPGGVIIPGLFDSFLGLLEAQGRYGLSQRWSIVGGARLGNGVMPWLAVESQLF